MIHTFSFWVTQCSLKKNLLTFTISFPLVSFFFDSVSPPEVSPSSFSFFTLSLLLLLSLSFFFFFLFSLDPDLDLEDRDRDRRPRDRDLSFFLLLLYNNIVNNKGLFQATLSDSQRYP